MMTSQSNLGLKFLSNISNLRIIEKFNEGDISNKFLFQDKATNEKYCVKVIPCEKNENKKCQNSSTLIIYQINEKENNYEITDSNIIKEDNDCKENNSKEMICESKNDNVFNYIKGHEFEGIFNYLNNKNNTLANFNGSINISSNGDERNHSFDIINKNFNDYYYPHPNENSYIKFDFKDHKVSLNNYTLRSKNIFYNKLINWEIEGSNNDINWDKIDERHIKEWYTSDYIETYSVYNHNFYQYIQIRLRGPSSNNDYLLALSNIELFGELK